MKSVIFLLIAMALIGALGLWWQNQRDQQREIQPAQPASSLSSSPTDEPLPLLNEAPTFDPALNGLNRPGVDILTDLRIVHDILQRYHVLAKNSVAVPLGDNRDVVRALQDHKHAGIAFLPKRHPTINDNGEWVDRWGTPFFFHAIARDRMEIRSAGPDQKFWTADDALYPPTRDRDHFPISRPARAEDRRMATP